MRATCPIARSFNRQHPAEMLYTVRVLGTHAYNCPPKHEPNTMRFLSFKCTSEVKTVRRASTVYCAGESRGYRCAPLGRRQHVLAHRSHLPVLLLLPVQLVGERGEHRGSRSAATLNWAGLLRDSRHRWPRRAGGLR